MKKIQSEKQFDVQGQKGLQIIGKHIEERVLEEGKNLQLKDEGSHYKEGPKTTGKRDEDDSEEFKGTRRTGETPKRATQQLEMRGGEVESKIKITTSESKRNEELYSKDKEQIIAERNEMEKDRNITVLLLLWFLYAHEMQMRTIQRISL